MAAHRRSRPARTSNDSGHAHNVRAHLSARVSVPMLAQSSRSDFLLPAHHSDSSKAAAKRRRTRGSARWNTLPSSWLKFLTSSCGDIRSISDGGPSQTKAPIAHHNTYAIASPDLRDGHCFPTMPLHMAFPQKSAQERRAAGRSSCSLVLGRLFSFRLLVFLG